MSKSLKIIFLAALIFVLIVSYIFFYDHTPGSRSGKAKKSRPQVALIFDDLGQNLKDLRQIYELNIPVTIAVIPGLKFSKNIAHIAARSGFPVLIHLPLEPKDSETYLTDKYTFISAGMAKNQIKQVLNNYLNSIRIAIGVNNHMGSRATEDSELMNRILESIKAKNLIFIDSRTSPDSVAYEIARKKGIKTACNRCFLDAAGSLPEMKKKLNNLIEQKQNNKFIVIAHPKKRTFEFFRSNLPGLRKKIDFITIRKYFNEG